MTPRALQKNKEGFTIIEVMIVLAIAGLIILIVFLAVPALQRNSRNTQRRNDAARVSGLIAEYVSNNNGQLPANAAAIPGVSGDLSYYTSVTDATAATTDVDVLGYVDGNACEDNALVAAGGRSYAVVFAVETSGGGGTGTAQCI